MIEFWAIRIDANAIIMKYSLIEIQLDIEFDKNIPFMTILENGVNENSFQNVEQ